MDDERDGPIALAVRVGSGFEALVGASALVTGGGASWPGRLADRQAVAAAVIARTGDTTGELWLHLLATAATDLPGEPDPDAVAGWLGSEDPLRLRRAVLGVDVPAWREVVPGEVLEAATTGRPDAVARLLADERYYAGRAADALAVLGPLDPAGTRRRLVAGFDEVRGAISDRLADELLAAQRAFVREHALPDETDALSILDRLAGGFAWTPEKGIRRLVVVPQLAGAGRLLLLQHRDARVAGVPIPTGRPSLAGLGAAFAAVGDEQRLRILQLLSHEQLGVSEVARRLGIAKSTAHHHLAMLREAGLIRLTGQAWRYAYQTREEAADTLAARLRLLLATPPEES